MTFTCTSRDRMSKIFFLLILLKQHQHPEWDVLKQDSISHPLNSLMNVSIEK